MRILADENVDAAIVAWLRQQGNDILSVAEILVGSPDSSVLEIANASARVLLTRDLDFGEIVVRERRISQGVILLRLKARNQWERLALLQPWWPKIEGNAEGHFITVTNTKIRIRSIGGFH